jgi:hypothetical protein
MRCPARCVCAACCLLGLTGCLNPSNYRLPTVFNKAPEIERVEQQYHDPYPDSQLGPSTGSRPLQYNEQRPLPVRIREKSDGTRVRGLDPSLTSPPVSPSPGSQYPAVVPF